MADADDRAALWSGRASGGASTEVRLNCSGTSLAEYWVGVLWKGSWDVRMGKHASRTKERRVG